MSVTIATNPQPASFWQRLTGTEPRTVITETSTTEVTSVPGGSFSFKDALRNGGIGAAIAGALGGVSLLGKVALPIIGKVGSIGGLAKLAGIGGALGIATAALPLVAPKVKESPAAKAALTGAAIGAAAGAVLPLMPVWLGASIGAGVGLLVNSRRNRPAPDYPVYPGYVAYPGFSPAGTAPGDGYPGGLVPVTPNYGSYAGSAVNPYGFGMPTGYGMPSGYGMSSPYGASMMSPYGYGTLAMQAGQQGVATTPQAVQPVATAAAAPVAARPSVTKPKHPKAKTWIDKAGNVRQVGTGKVLKAAAGRPAHRPVAARPAATTTHQVAASPVGASPYAQLTSPASYLPGMASSLPMSGMSPLTAGSSMLGAYAGAMPQAMAGAMPTTAAATPALGIAPGAIPARPVA